MKLCNNTRGDGVREPFLHCVRLRRHMGNCVYRPVEPGSTIAPVTSAAFCEHANEVPSQCPCPPGCYCRRRGNTCSRRCSVIGKVVRAPGTGHSPAPWRWSSGGWRLEDANGSPIIGMNRIEGGTYMPGGPDAELLAAAPDLRRELAEARKQRDESVGLLREWDGIGYGPHATSEKTAAFLRGIDQENKDKP